MNDLVSEYQQYQDATAEGKLNDRSSALFSCFSITTNSYNCLMCLFLVEEGEGGEEEGEHDGA
jgi:hypothetical protein